MPQLRFLANMNISPETVHDLRNQGWDIIRIPQVLPVNASDQVFIYRQIVLGRVVKRITSGYSVRVNGYLAFCPSSEMVPDIPQKEIRMFKKAFWEFIITSIDVNPVVSQRY
jgi:hypothetical protein